MIKNVELNKLQEEVIKSFVSEEIYDAVCDS